MAYQIGSLSTIISGIPENTSKTIIFKEKTADKHSTKPELKQRGKRKHTESDNSKTKKPKYSARRLESIRLENESQDDGGSYDTDANIPFMSNSSAENNSLETLHTNSNTINALKRISSKQNIKKPVHDDEQESRTVFVKNLPHSLDKKKIKKIFKKYGDVESVRLRCAAVEDVRVSKKFAVIKSKFHAERTSICAFIRFCLKDGAVSALAANGTVVQDHHIFVDEATNSTKQEQKKSIFLGNVPFSAEEEEIWKIFEKCGKIVDIRIVRDTKTGIGKGFAYVTFESPDEVELALSLNGTLLKERALRISRVLRKRKPALGHTNYKVRQRSGGNSKQKRSFEGKFKNKIPLENNKEENSATRKLSHISSEKRSKKQDKQKHLPFQGQKSLDRKQKKKQKINKMEQKKKIVALKLNHKADHAKKKSSKKKAAL